MRESSRSGVVVAFTLFIGIVLGGLTELFTPWLSTYLGVSAEIIFGVGIVIVEGPTLIAAIVISRRVTRMWVRSALQAAGPFLGFFGYIVAYGFLRHPPFAFPF
jgi:hypothetical protein